MKELRKPSHLFNNKAESTEKEQGQIDADCQCGTASIFGGMTCQFVEKMGVPKLDPIVRPMSESDERLSQAIIQSGIIQVA